MSSSSRTAADEDGDSDCNVTTEHDAERAAGRIGKDSKRRLAFARYTSGKEREHLSLGLVGIIDTNIEVQLLRIGGVWPLGGDSATRWNGSCRRPGLGR